ncbi:hypothetical protein ACXR0O_11545 [Verrucomicrobiota bacterium sgz303538]
MKLPLLFSLRTSPLRSLLLPLLACVCGISGHGRAATIPEPVPDAVRQQFHLAPFYQKYVDAGGLPIVGSSKVSDDALKECAWIVQHMLEKRPDILQALGKTGVRFAVMAYNEYTTDIPEHSTLQPQVYWDRRARGLGATQERPAVSCAEENLLAYPGDNDPVC